MPKPTRTKTPLELALSPGAKDWLARYSSERFDSLHGSLRDWRGRMKKYSDRSKENFDDRQGDVDELTGILKIFNVQNDTLATVGGFADFAYAQAKEDIFGSDLFFGAKPVGSEDVKVAEVTTKHAAWKWDQSTMVPQLKKALRKAIDIGTAFPKATYRREVETYTQAKTIAYDKTTGEAIQVAGRPIEDINAFVPLEATEDGTAIVGHESDPTVQLPADNVAWREVQVPQEDIAFSNVEVSTISYKDIAFDPTAISWSLIHTDVFHQFDIGLLDAVEQFGLGQDEYDEIRGLINSNNDSDVDDEHSTPKPAIDVTEADEKKLNPPIKLVEGYMRCDPFGTGKPIRLYVILAPTLQRILLCDYLRNRTPKGRLPITPLRCYQEENQICGIGYHEKYEYANDDIDEQYSAVKHRNRLIANPPSGIDYSVFKEDRETLQLAFDPSKPQELNEGRTMKEGITFAEIPDKNNRSIELLNMQMQMLQMRSGISSPAQGSMENLPSTNTATGVQALLSRANILLASHIKDTRRDVRDFLRYCLDLTHANLEDEETFAWGDGEDAAVLTMRAADVRGIEFDVNLQVSQTLNQERLQNAQTAIGMATTYLGIAEIWKENMRPLFEQAFRSLGFENADQVLPHASTDPALFLESLPPELIAILPEAAILAQSIQNDQTTEPAQQ